MESASIIARLKYICDDEYAEKTSLSTLYTDVIQYKDYMSEKLSPELYKYLCSELDCVYYESRLGESMYTEDVFSDLTDALKDIIEFLEAGMKE